MADRGIPAPGKETSLPSAVAINALHELAKTAADEVQSKTVGSMIDELAAVSVSKDDLTLGRSTAEGARDRAGQALMEYARTTESTAAESVMARMVRYEREVLLALAQAGISVSTHAIQNGDIRYYPDAFVNIDGDNLLVEIKYFTRFDIGYLVRSLTQFQTMVSLSEARFGILICPADISDGTISRIKSEIPLDEWDVGIVSWTPDQGYEQLIELIRREISR